MIILGGLLVLVVVFILSALKVGSEFDLSMERDLKDLKGDN